MNNKVEFVRYPTADLYLRRPAILLIDSAPLLFCLVLNSISPFHIIKRLLAQQILRKLKLYRSL